MSPGQVSRANVILFCPCRDPDMELREEAWSPGPLDSEDQQMASHENPGAGPRVHTDPYWGPFWGVHARGRV